MNTQHSHKGTDTARIDVGRLLTGEIAGENWLASANYDEGVTGWKLFGDGTFEGNEGHFRGDITGASGFFTGEISVGTSPNWFRVNANGDMWLGRDNLAEAKVNTFAVTKEGVLYTKSAVIGKWNVNTTSIYTGTEDHSGYTANAGDLTIYSDGSDASLHAKQFYIDTTGVLYATGVNVSGTITASGGAIGGWTINGTSIYTGTEDHSGYTANAGDITIYSDGSDSSIHAKNWYIDTTGVFYTVGATLDGTSTLGGRVGSTLASAIDSSGHFIDANFNTSTLNILASFTFGVSGALQIGTYSAGVSGDIKISPSGILGRNSANATTFSIDGTTGAAVFSGTVTALAGAIGGWTINATSITDIAGVVGMSSAVTGGDDIRFWAGHTTPASASFKVTEAGALTATSATITGTITSTSGTIGGFTLAANTLSSGTDDDYVGMSSAGTNAFWAGDSTFADAEFSVTAAGVLKATSATITGAITASSGSVGSFTIGTYLYTGTKTAYNDANAGVHLGSDGIGIGNNVFTVSSAGAVVATSATVTGAINATSGKIGTATDYWSIGATGITAVSAGTDVIINYGKTDFTNTDTGFILGYDFSATKSKFYIGNTTDYFNFDGTNVAIKTTLADAIIIDYGSNILLKEGGSIKFTSVTAPTACTATLVEIAGNVDSGDHRYSISYVTATGETSLGTYSNTVTTDGTYQKVNLTSIPLSVSSAVTSKKIYRTKIGNALAFYLLDTIASDATTYLDNTADSSLGVDDIRSKENSTFGKLIVDNVTVLFTSYSNTFIGQSAGTSETSGRYNVAIGSDAFEDNTTGNENVAVGVSSLLSNTTGTYNTAIGVASLASCTTGNYNTAIGHWSGAAVQTGSRNVFIGYHAGYYETGSNAFYVDIYDRTDTAGDKAGAILYGVLNSNPASQTLTINAITTVTYAISASNLSGSNTGDQTLSGLGGAPNTITCLTATAEGGLSAEVNLGALSTGLLKGTVAAGVSTISAVTDSSSNWNTAYGWGNHASAGYLTSVTAHNLLSTTHGDTTASSCARGSVIVGDVNTKWVNLAFPATPTGKVLIATATDVAWSASALGTAAYAATGDFLAVAGTAAAVTGLSVVAGQTLTVTTGGTLVLAGYSLTLAQSGTLGTAAYTASTAYEASGAVSTHAALLTGIHGLAITAGQTLTVTTGGTLGSAAYTASGAYDVAGAAAAVTPTTLGLVIGTNTQAYSATLAAVAGGTYTGDDSITTLGTIATGIWNGTTIKANYLQNAAADLGAANITIVLSNSNGAYVTNLTTDGTVTAGTFTDGTVSITGGTFSAFPVTPSSAPTANYQVVNKKYVDDNSTVVGFVVSNNLRHSNDATKTTASGAMTKLKEILMNVVLDAVRINHRMEHAGAGTNYYRSQIYKNGVAWGTLRTQTNAASGYDYSEDLGAVAVGDLIQLYAQDLNGQDVSVLNFRLYYDLDFYPTANWTNQDP